jgi:YegS/Rv2252/BmrU family lipid kinase
MPRALLLINPNSRNGDSNIETALDVLRAGGIELVSPPPLNKGDVARLIAERGAGCDLVIVGGGDGTLNHAVEGILRLGCPLGVLPLGTANDLARTIGLPTDLSDCARVIVEGRTRRVDLGRANDKHFFNIASLGVSAEVARELDRDLKARFGVLGYALVLWRVVARRRVIRADLRYEGRRLRVRAIQISIGNGRFYGGGMAIAADAGIDDGILDLVVVRPQSFWQLVARALIFRWGRHDLNDRVHHVRGRRIELRTRAPLPVNTDGEVTTETPVTFEVMPGAIEVFVPGRAAADPL